MSHQMFMEKAIGLSHEKMLANHGGPFGAVVVFESHIVGEGYNRVTSALDPTAHAEVTAIRAACQTLERFSLEGCSIYTSCEPCPMCLGAIYWARLDRVYYAATQDDAARIQFDDMHFYEELKKPMHLRKVPMEQLMRPQALEVFDAWAIKADKTHY